VKFVVCNDFDDCNGDNLENRCIIISFDESELYSKHDLGSLWCFYRATQFPWQFYNVRIVRAT
jgi:hypothetical protein